MSGSNKAFVTNMVIGGAVATILIWGVGEFASVTVPEEVAAAVATILGATFGSFGADPE